MTQIETIRANRIEIAYRFDGPENGQVVLLSNSLSSDHTMWDPQLPALTDTYRVLRYDNRGHGRSQVTPPPYSVEQLAEDARALVQALGIGRIHFCGLSLGGMIGQVLGVRYPEMLRSLTLCDTTSQMRDPSIWDERIRMVREKGMRALVPMTLERWFTKPFREKAKEEMARVSRMIEATPPDGYVGCCNAIAAMNQTRLLNRIEAPTLVIVGEEDPATPVEHAEELQREIPDAELIVLDEASHLSNIEQPAAFNAALRTHLDRHS